MCVGIAVVGIVPPDGGPIQFFGENGNSSHDELLSKYVPVELHNRSFKLEYIFPDIVRLDAPDEVCRQQAIELGMAVAGPWEILCLAPGLIGAVWSWIAEHAIQHDKKTLQCADLQEANLQCADLQEANLQRANLQDANLQGANLQWAIVDQHIREQADRIQELEDAGRE